MRRSRINTSYTSSIGNWLLTVLAIGAGISALTVSIVGFNETAVPTGNGLQCNENSTINSTCLPDSGVTPGTYEMPIVTVDSKGRITNVVEAGPIFNVSGLYTVYVDGSNGNDANDGLTLATPKMTLNGAIQAFAGVVAHQCVIQVGVYVELGTNPTFNFFPATFGCDKITVKGERIDVVNDSIQETVFGVGAETFSQVATVSGGGLVAGAYDCSFIDFYNLGNVFAVESNTENDLIILADRDALAVPPSFREFELYNLKSELRWTGPFYITSSQPIFFQDMIFEGSGPNTILNVRSSETSVYSGVRFNFDTVIGISLETTYLSGDFAISGGVIKPPSAARYQLCVNLNSTIVQGSVFTRPNCNADLFGVWIETGGFISVFDIQFGSVLRMSNVRIETRTFICRGAQITGKNINVAATTNMIFSDASRVIFTEHVSLSALTEILVTEQSIIDIRSATAIQSVNDFITSLVTKVTDISTFKVGTTTFNSKLEIERASTFMAALRFWNYNGDDPMVSLEKGSAFAIVNSPSVLLTWNVGTSFNTTPLIDVQGASRTFSTAGLGGLDNQNFPGQVIRCGTNAIGPHLTPSNDLSTNTFCS